MKSLEKQRRLDAISTPDGIIAAIAMDQRKSLREVLGRASNSAPEAITDAQLTEFKSTVSEVLSPYGSAILLDPEYGLDAVGRKSSQSGLLLTYESDGYENPRPHRMLALMPQFSVTRLRELGADAIKVLLSYNPDGDARANDEKRCWIERIGAECDAVGVAFLLEPVVYDPAGAAPRSLEFAARKPDLVVRTMQEFSKPIYRVDILKVEFPVIAAFVEGCPVYQGKKAYSYQEALDWFAAADAAAGCPYIYLSAGAEITEFLTTLEMAAAAHARFSGVLCGRAIWQEGIPEYVRGGREALEGWLRRDGIRYAEQVMDRLKPATSWRRVRPRVQ